MTISLKKTVVMPVEAHKPPRILINTSLLKVVVKPSVSLDDEINQRLGKLSTNFGRLSSSWNNHHLTEVRVYSACYAAAGRGAQCAYHRPLPSPPSCMSVAHTTLSPSWGSDVCPGWAMSVVLGEWSLARRTSFAANFVTRHVNRQTQVALQGRHQAWHGWLPCLSTLLEHLLPIATDIHSQPTNYADKMENRRAHRRQRQDGLCAVT